MGQLLPLSAWYFSRVGSMFPRRVSNQLMKNLASVFVVVVSLLPNSSAEAESEDNGEELSGGHSNYSADRQVEVAADVVLQLVVAARVQE